MPTAATSHKRNSNRFMAELDARLNLRHTISSRRKFAPGRETAPGFHFGALPIQTDSQPELTAVKPSA
jgi:hypothetical protein